MTYVSTCSGDPRLPALPVARIRNSRGCARLSAQAWASNPAFRSHFARLFGADAVDQWHFVSSAPDDAVSEEEEEDQLRALGWFALLRVQRGAAAEERRGPVVTVAPLGAVVKGAPLLACGSPFGAFCPDIFLNTLSRGVLSNAAGPLLLTDARCLPGTEGGGVFAARPAGIVASNTRDNNTGATYPHLNFSIPITVLQPALKQYSQTGDLGGLRELDHTTEPVRVVWRLQRPLSEVPRSKL